MVKKKDKEKKKPTAKIPVIPSSKILKQYASSNYTMFKGTPRTYEPQSDNRSIFFKSEWDKEIKKL